MRFGESLDMGAYVYHKSRAGLSDKSGTALGLLGGKSSATQTHVTDKRYVVL